MNLPETFVQNMRPILGDAWDDFQRALQAEPAVSVRLHPLKSAERHVLLPDARSVVWCEGGYYLPYRPSFTPDPLFQAGAYYVQEASSMFLYQAIKRYVSPSARVLDLCAAPGGKSTHIASLLGENGVLVSNEVVPSRSVILLENVLKSGYPNVIVTQAEAKDFAPLTSVFDAILVDAPCSGEGMFRKDERAIAEWSPENVELCAVRQQRILKEVWPSLREGGVLIYSTCTYNIKENEENVLFLMNSLGAELLPLNVPADWGISPSLCPEKVPYVYRFLPYRMQGEGLFMAVLRKTGGEGESNEISRKSLKQKLKQKTSVAIVPSEAQLTLKNPEKFVFENANSRLRAYPQSVAEILPLLQKIRILNAGVPLGELKGKNFVPSHALALSCALQSDCFVRHELTPSEAPIFLCRENLVLPDAPKGYILLCFEGLPIGIVKNLGNRTNSLLPVEWRIRSASVKMDEVRWLK